MPLPLLSALSDAELFPIGNAVVLGWGALIVAPRWRHTQGLAMLLVALCSALYLLLAAHRLLLSPLPLPAGAGFGTLEEVERLFSDEAAVYAGWTHYLAFDLFVGRFIVADSQRLGLPHLAVAWTLPLTLMAGPVGLLAYLGVRGCWLAVPSRAALARRVLLALYGACCALSLFMVVWVLVLPSSWLAGNSEWHDRLFAWAVRSIESPPAPLTVVSTKWHGHLAVQLMHTLPSGLWSALLPVQLHRGLRARHRLAHRRAGYAFVGCALLMMCGLVEMDRRGLYYYQRDFPSLREDEATSRLGFGHHHREAFLVVGCWFAATVVAAVAAARRKRFELHQDCVLRHAGAGLWVAVQRVMLGLFPGRTPAEQKANFGDFALIGLAITVVGAELAIWALRVEREEKEEKEEKKKKKKNS